MDLLDEEERFLFRFVGHFVWRIGSLLDWDFFLNPLCVFFRFKINEFRFERKTREYDTHGRVVQTIPSDYYED